MACLRNVQMVVKKDNLLRSFVFLVPVSITSEERGLQERIVIISDLHIGAGPLDDFDSELESQFCYFLEKLSSSRDSVELVINGDFLDFVQAEPWRDASLRSTTSDGIQLCFSEEQSLAKLSQIHKSHQPVFGAIQDFLKLKRGNRLTVLPGNHDVDFFWRRIREDFTVKSAPKNSNGQIFFCLDQCYTPQNVESLWIEHGHQYDPLNCFNVGGEVQWTEELPPIFEDIHGVKRLYECTGTRFLNKFLNELDLMYPFVDNVKPFSRFLSIFGTSAFIPGYGPLKAALAIWALLKDLATTLPSTPRDILDTEDNRGPDLRPILNHVLREMSDEDRKLLTQELRERGYQAEIPLSMLIDDLRKREHLASFLIQHFDLVPDVSESEDPFLSNNKDEGFLDLTRGLLIDETQELVKASSGILKRHPSVDTVVMGHTHEAMQLDNYFNTGSWTRFYSFNKQPNVTPWSFLRSFSYSLFPYQLRYFNVISKSPNTAQISLFSERFNGRSEC